MEGPMVVTTETIPGYRVIEVRGLVVGIHVFPYSPFHNGVKDMSTGKTVPIERLREIVAVARREAIADMMATAQLIGGQAVLGARFDTRSLTATWAEILCYGTAVTIEASR